MRTITDFDGTEKEVENMDYGLTETDLDQIVPCDMRREVEDNPGTRYEYYTGQVFNEDGNAYAEGIRVLYLPQEGRAGVCWGGDSRWTDCESAEDAVDRFFGNDGKEMCN